MAARRIVLLGAVGLALVGAARAAGEADGVRWLDEPRRALDLAERERRPVLVDIWAIWCAPCKLMDETTYREPAVVAAMAGFAPLKVDADLHTTVIERYDIDAYPTVLFLDENGREISRLLGFVDAPRMLAAMKPVADGYAEYLKARQDEKNPWAQATIGQYLLRCGAPGEAVKPLERALKGMSRAPAAEREALELALAEAQLASGREKSAAAGFAGLFERSADRETRARALWGLHRAEKEGGRDAEASEALERLERDYPDIATRLEKS